jgi:hypothetical protein
MYPQDADQWIAVLKMAWEKLATKPAPRLWASPCLRHRGCVWVAIGSRVEHFQWQQTEPAELAEDFMASLP